jgi:OPA family glycerol-3-phosphate transporter-like MFS transporter
MLAKLGGLPDWTIELGLIFTLLLVVAGIVSRLPKVDLGHSQAFRRRRVLNWLPLGFTYSFLYMGRYNLNACKNALGDVMSKADFGTIFFWGTLTYGFAFVINGPLTDRIGGRRTIIIAALGSAACNLAMGWVLASGQRTDLVTTFSILYAANMYFQSFGAVSIVKVNAAWFHVRERGTFGGIFGVLISLGVYFAYDWGRVIATYLKVQQVFYLPALILIGFAVLDYAFVFDSPSDTGHPDFDTADASSGDDGPRLSLRKVALLMLKSPIIVTIAAIEFMSGYLRNGIMQWFPIFAKETGAAHTFVAKHWGMMLCMAGILGGMFAGVISDRVFQSRRGPVAAVLYGGMLAGCAVGWTLLGTPLIGWVMVAMSLCIIGVHGMLSGTASMDFGGKKNVGVAVGIIDGMVYLGTALEALVLGWALPKGAAQRLPENWSPWLWVLLPPALIGTLLALRIWNAKPQPKGGGH